MLDMPRFPAHPATLLSIFALFLTAGRVAGQDANAPGGGRRVEFRTQIAPILKSQCLACHSADRHRGGLVLNTRENALSGGESGPAIVPGDSAASLLMQRVTSTDPDLAMPRNRPRLPDADIALLRAWIDQGLEWTGDASGVDAALQYDLKLREVTLPTEAGSADAARRTHPIDALLAPYFAEYDIRVSAVDDSVFLRRAYLDVIGLLPTPAEQDEFARDTRPEKRALLARKLLDDRRRYAEHWLTFWNDLLRNDYKGTGYIDGGRQQITQWLHDALYENKPYDRFVTELVAPTPGSEGFASGIIWRGVVNASQTPPMQAAQNVSQVFLGLNLKCASCHDSFINDWKLADAYGLASVFADGPLEMSRCDQPQGKTAAMKFLFPQLGAIDASAPRAARQARLAEVLVCPENGRFTRTIVNRLWARFFGRGLVEPVDEMDRAAWNADLLDFLSSELIRSGYDLKKLMELMLTSAAYQMPSVDAGERENDAFVFRGPSVRRMSAEQFVDAVREVTGAWPQTGDAVIRDHGQAPQPPGRWIWNDPQAAVSAPGGTPLAFRRVFELPAAPRDAIAVIACDNQFKLFVNGVEAGAGKDFGTPQRIDLRANLHSGRNAIAIEALNFAVPPGPDGKPAGNPAGLFVLVRAWSDTGPAVEISSDTSWKWSATLSAGWNAREFDDNAWQPAAELGTANIGPWMLAERIAEVSYDPSAPPQFRAALQAADPLTTALGRPNRDQVCTVRPTAATTLQALELTNGRTFDALIAEGARRWSNQTARTPKDLTRAVFKSALGRLPNDAELWTAGALLGEAPTPDSISDLFWTVFMLPEFQLIE